ncbi:MAG: decaprenyl-phosphate phosphoribosyltransferase [Nitrospira sp.]|nr:decaprenyl-phosphate phosphoribosyltransferase [Nitrospira sp.]
MKSRLAVTNSEAGFWGNATLLLAAMRPIEWVKNGFVAAPLFFSGQATELEKVSLAGLALMAFCAMSSVVYLLNDITDRERDRLHPTKRLRPIASGNLSVRVAGIAIPILIALSFGLASFSWEVLGVLACYGLVNVAYTLRLKQVVIVDLISIALGFVLRVYAGGFAIGVSPSSWLVLATFLLSLFLALAKRRHELSLIGIDAPTHRPVLENYSIKFVDELISVVTPTTLLTYILYTLDSVTVARLHSRHLFLTSVFVVFGIFRYLYLIHQKGLGGSPSDLVLKDIPLLSTILGWILSFALIVYFSGALLPP